jgi:hypothetical protein
MARHQTGLPRKRSDLVEVDLADEVLLYERHSHAAHALNGPAALVWRGLDGRTSIAELAHRLQKEFGGPDSTAAVWLALKDLAKLDLLEGRLTVPQAGAVSRRQLLQGMAVTAGVVLPVIASIASPHAGAVASATGCTTADCINFTCAGKDCCSCVTIAEGNKVCVARDCSGASCTTSAGCPPGYVCFTQGCCVAMGAPGSGIVKPQAAAGLCIPICTPATICPPPAANATGGSASGRPWGGRSR